jgi:putative phosphoribosyl transferase
MNLWIRSTTMFTWMKDIGLPDRQQAGRELADRLEHYRAAVPLIVGLPRGGIVVAAELARHLGCPLDILVSQRIWAPWQPDLAIGAVALGGTVLFDPFYVSLFRLSAEDLQKLAADALADVEHKSIRYRVEPTLPPVRGRTVIVVDDGLSHSSTVRAAVRALRQAKAKWIVVAVGVAHPAVVSRLRPEADEVVCLLEPDPIGAVRFWFRNYESVTDDDVTQYLVDGALHYEAVKARRKADPQVTLPLHTLGVRKRRASRTPRRDQPPAQASEAPLQAS